MTMPLDVDRECRPHFPALKGGFIFADNAGGSQCLKDVADRVYDYLLNTNAQLGADYSVSAIATTRTMVDAQASTASLINAASPKEISLGSSSTMLCENLARGIEPDIQSDEELVVSFADHEANIGPWVRLSSRKNLKLVPWSPRPATSSSANPFAVKLHVEDLQELITSKTRVVAFTACSNILGEFTNPKEIISTVRQIAKAKGARKIEVCVDCVAYAPHRSIDVQAWDADYVFFSYYKVYGPHVSVLYTRESSLENSVTSLAHFFLKALKLQPGGPGYELTYSITGVLPYFLRLGSEQTPKEGDAISGMIGNAFERIAKHEEKLMNPLIEFLESKKDSGVRIVGPESGDPAIRAPTISFVVVNGDGSTRIKSKDIVAVFDKTNKIGIRYGHFYSYRLLSSLGLDPDDGVVRISLVHYNTVEEAQDIIDVLKTVLQS